MKRRGYRSWKRIICRIIGHDPWYAATRKNWYGLIVAYRMNCWRCGQEIETLHPEAFGMNLALVGTQQTARPKAP